MKIERINDNQFRCTMTLGELLQRHLTLKKISSDSGEARRLVREILDRSVEELGFEPNEYPVMVEAVRNPEGNLVFTITKFNSPEEMPPQVRMQAQADNPFLTAINRALKEHEEQLKIRHPNPLAVFSFPQKDGVKLPPRLTAAPKGVSSSLYLMPEAGQYFLVISASPKAIAAFRQVCLLLTEYGRPVPATSATKAYYDEHAQTVFARRAIEQLQPQG